MFKMNDNMIKYDVFYLPLVCRERAPPFCFPECNAATVHHTVLSVIEQALIDTLWDITINENIWQKSRPWCVF